MPVDVFPEFAPPKVEIQTEGLGMTVHRGRRTDHDPDGGRAARHARHRHTCAPSSVVGLSQVVLLFKPGTDLMDARQRVQERLKLAIAELPQSAGMPVMLQPLSSTSRVMKIGLTSKDYDLMDLSMIAYWTIKFRLMAVPGVANVPIWGDRIKSLQVQVDPSLMRAHNVTLDEVMETTSDALDVGPAALQHRGARRASTACSTRPTSGSSSTTSRRCSRSEHLAEVPIAIEDAGALEPPRLRDVANVAWDTWPLVGDAVINDGPGLMMIVEKLPWANTLDVTRGVEEALDALEARPARRRDRLRRSSGRRPSSRLSMDNLTRRADHRLRCWWSSCSAPSCSNGASR